MSDDTTLGLGNLITGDRERDAIHIAIIPVEAGEELEPGQHVTIVDGKAVGGQGHVGIVDPFLGGEVPQGQRFWLLLYPGTIRSLRHEWTHPAFPIGPGLAGRSEAEAAAEAWLRTFAEDNGVGFHRMVEAMVSGDGITLSYDIERGVDEEFWARLETLTGRRFDGKHRDSAYFSCSC